MCDFGNNNILHTFVRRYLEQVQGVLPTVLDEFDPQLVIYDAGVDPHSSDSLGLLELSDQGLLARDTFVINSCLDRNIPVVTVIGGGYDRDHAALGKRHALIIEAAAGCMQHRL
jgi:acetoin utilization deacetylase AcuC-like enzyme